MALADPSVFTFTAAAFTRDMVGFVELKYRIVGEDLGFLAVFSSGR
jgi:hypothetical protein